MTQRQVPLIWREIHFPQPLDAATAIGLLERILADVHLGQIVVETRACGGRARTLVATRHSTGLDALIRSLVPGARVSAPRHSRYETGQTLRLRVSRPQLPLSTDRLEAVVRAVLAAMAATSQDEELIIQVMIGPRYHPSLVTGDPGAPYGWLELLGLAQWSRPGSRTVGPRVRARAACHRAGATIRLGACAKTPARRRALLTNLLGALRLTESAGVRLRARTEAAWRLNEVRRPWRYPLTLTAHELACLVGWPIGGGKLPATPGEHPRYLPLPEHRDTTRIFVTSADDSEPGRLGITIQDALHHTLLLGPTGVGKSTAMAHLALADIRARRGLLLIDPKTDLVHDLLARIPPERQADVVVIDPTSPTPVGINPLARAPGRSPELAADVVLSTFKQLYAEAWGPRTEDVLTSGLLTLARTPGSTLVDLPLLLTSPALRARIVTAAPDPLGTDQFWTKYDQLSDAQRLSWIAPVLNKLQAFLIRPHLRAVLGQSQPRFDLAELFTRRRIILVALNRGTLGPESARLLGSLVVGQIWPLILARASLPPARRHVVSVYIDEVQDFLSLPGDLADALAQARSLGVAFHIAHQYRAQLPPALRAGIDANVRNKIIFGLGAADAAEMAKHAAGLEAQDFQLLPRFSVYARTLHSGHTQPWAMARTLPLPPITSNPAHLTAASATRYGQNAKAVEEDTLQRLELKTPIGSNLTDPLSTSVTSPTAPASSGMAARTVIGRRPANRVGKTTRRTP